jgi:hypothetical protein
MFAKKMIMTAVALASSAAAIVPTAAVNARDWDGRGHYEGSYDRGSYDRDYRGSYGRGSYDRGYYDRSAYYGGGYDRRYYGGRYRHDRCSDGTGGTIIGAIAGGLLGNSIAGYGDRGIGTVIGAGAGALAGRAIDRSSC